MFVDPDAIRPYLFHLATLSTVRRADQDYPEAFGREQMLEQRLVAVTYTLDGAPAEAPVELLMLLWPVGQVPLRALPALEKVREAVSGARAYLEGAVAAAWADRWRDSLAASLGEGEKFLQSGFDYQESDLIAARAKLKERMDAGDAEAARALEGVRKRQRALQAQRDRAIAVLRRGPELVAPAEIGCLAHALVLPSSDPEERARHDREVERIAVAVATAYEESLGARVEDVSDPKREVGCDLLSHRPTGEERCIEVKGRRGVGDVELAENEWARAANLREHYCLYVVYDCAAAQSRLPRVKDPFGRLLFKMKGGVIIDEVSVFQAAEGE